MKIIFALALHMTSAFALAKSTEITLRYSPVFDSWCSQQTGIEILPIEKQHLIDVFPSLQTAWNTTGPSLLQATVALIGRPFLQREMVGTVFLCKKTPSMSMPLLINGNWFTKKNPEPSDLVVDIIHHELLHTYLVDHFVELWDSSPLLKKYRNEEPGVLSHLHLMAIQKKVYMNLGLKDRIQRVIQFDSESYRGAYKRSWEIVNLEGEDQFVKELK